MINKTADAERKTAAPAHRPEELSARQQPLRILRVEVPMSADYEVRRPLGAQ